MNPLTRRQTEFLEQFLQLYLSHEEPLHYSQIALSLNVQNATAYEMLRTLEGLGYLYREFRLPAGNHSPGRATVYFLPTELALELVEPQTEPSLVQKEWELLTSAILEKLKTYRNQDYKKWLLDIANLFTNKTKPIFYATKMITAIVVTLASLKDTVGKTKLVEFFHKLGLGNQHGLNNLAGVGLALSLLENVNSQLVGFLEQQGEPFQEVLITLEEDKKQQLSDFANEAFKIALH